MKKVLILTQPLRTNYGGILQAYALQKTIADMGFEVVTDNPVFLRRENLYGKLKDVSARFVFGILKGDKKYRPLFKKKLKRKDYLFSAQNTERFIKENIVTLDFFKGKKRIKPTDIEKFDIFICGSDQIWRRIYGDVRRYFFDFLKKSDKKRFSYAASFGLDNINEYSVKEKSECKELIKKFSAVSVREEDAVDIIKKEFSGNAVQVLDPTLLISKEQWRAIYVKECQDKVIKQENEVSVQPDGVSLKQKKNIFTYILDKTPAKEEIIDILSRRLDMDTRDIMPKKNWKQFPSDKESVFASVETWIKSFDDADFVITDSFHGTVFSIIFNKPFVCIANKDRGLSRFTSLLNLFGLNERIVFSKKDINGIFLHNLLKTNYDSVNADLEKHRSFSLYFLKKQLFDE
ncbi:MAG: polysaccharide pyruvyl transferase family protein [Bacteroidales bacterium]|nr:polysaccharide pyruvyl transferase family protein [Bacteroidales bacterium]